MPKKDLERKYEKNFYYQGYTILLYENSDSYVLFHKITLLV